MTREQIRQHKDHLDKMDVLSERILIVICVAATAVWIKVLVQALSMIGGK